MKTYNSSVHLIAYVLCTVRSVPLHTYFIYHFQKEPDAPRPKSATFLRAHTKSGPSVKLRTRPCTPDPKLSVPAASEANDVRAHFSYA